MGAVAYKANDIVRIKSFAWYHKNKDKNGVVFADSETPFYEEMTDLLGCAVRLSSPLGKPEEIKYPCMSLDGRMWLITEEMIGGLVKSDEAVKAFADVRPTAEHELEELKRMVAKEPPVGSAIKAPTEQQDDFTLPKESLESKMSLTELLLAEVYLRTLLEGSIRDDVQTPRVDRCFENHEAIQREINKRLNIE